MKNLWGYRFGGFISLLAVLFCIVTSAAFAQLTDADALLIDIPEPPDAQHELPTPVPMVYEFMDGLMGGDFDKCLANFDVETFLSLMFKRALSRLNEAEYKELYSYHIQAQRNEFRFLSKIMNRVAKGARIDYSDPRYHRTVQSKIVVRLSTHRGRFDFAVYCRFKNERWWVYDYILNEQRFSTVFMEDLSGMKIDHYISSLRPFYDQRWNYRTVVNNEYGISLKIPSIYEIRENVSSALLAAISGMDGQILVHIQAAVYSSPQTLNQVAKEISETIMPFNPRLYDQWKTDIAGVDIGNILFHFDKNSKRLYTHMVIIPIREKLVVINFYHSSLAMMKNFTNIRDKILESLTLNKVEAAGGDIYLPPDDLSLPDDYNPTELEPYPDSGSGNSYLEIDQDGQTSEPEIPPPPPGYEYQVEPPPPPVDPNYNYGYDEEDDSLPPPEDGNQEDPSPPPPPPPPQNEPDSDDYPDYDDYPTDYPTSNDSGEVYF